MPQKGQKDPNLKRMVKCKKCGIIFLKYRHFDKYKKTKNYFCSQKCFVAWSKIPENNPNWQNKTGEFRCDNCGKLFKRKKYEIEKYKNNYCSKECRIEGSKTLVKLNCDCCNKEIEKPQKYIEKYNHFFCNRSCRAAWMCGPNSPSWNGGSKSLKYCNAWSDKEFKDELKNRDGYQCLNPLCFKKDNQLVLHHIDYNKHNCNPNNLITICNDCNLRANTMRNWHKSWYRAIMYRRYGHGYEKAA